MVLTHINRALIYLAAAGLWLAALSVQGHPGRTDAEGCHAGTQPRHCHGSKQSERPAQTNPGASARDTGRPVPRKTATEAEYNRRFCATVNGETETRHGYTSAADGRSFVAGGL